MSFVTIYTNAPIKIFSEAGTKLIYAKISQGYYNMKFFIMRLPWTLSLVDVIKKSNITGIQFQHATQYCSNHKGINAKRKYKTNE